jgi:LAO/AO transport system kinase
MADAVFINKADGENRGRAEQARAEQEAATHHLQAFTPGWKLRVGLCSAVTGQGLPEIWNVIEKFYADLQPRGVLERQRRQQMLDWLNDLAFDELRRRFQRDERVKTQLPIYQQALLRGEITAVNAAKALLDLHGMNRGNNDQKN